MFNIMDEIEKIVQNYKIDNQKFFKTQLEKLMADVLKRAAKKYGNRVIIRGLKETEEEIHPFLQFVEKYMNIICVQDRTQEENQIIRVSKDKEVPIIPLNQDIPKCDVYLINALFSGPAIKFEMENKEEVKDVLLLDIYYELKQNYGVYPGKIYELYDKEYDYTSRRIKDAFEVDKKERNENSLMNLLGQCLCIGDFTSFFKIREIEKSRINTSLQIINFIKDVEDLIERTKSAIYERQFILNGKKDIIWQWIDSINYDELYMLPKVEKRMKNGVFFTESYTQTPYTRPTIRTIFWNEFRRNTENKDGGYQAQSLDKSKLFLEITNEGYFFDAFGLVKKVIDPAYEGHENAELSTASSMHYLRMLDRLLSSNQPCFFIVHILEETHMPFTSPWENIPGGGYMFSDIYSDLEEKIRISAQYIDEVVDHYANIMGNQCISIYMSDHGKWGFTEKRRYKDESIHTFLGITNLEIKAEVSKLFSYENFDSLIDWIIKMNKDKKEMLFGDLEIYSEGFRGAAKKQGGDIDDICSGFIGVNTKLDKYVLMDDGKEYYFLKKEKELFNRINEEEYSNRIKYLKEKLAILMEENKKAE